MAKTIKQEKNSKDCLACVAAMATETSVIEYKRFCKKNELYRYDDIALYSYLEEKGFAVGVFSPESDPFTKENLQHIDLLTAPCYLVVESTKEAYRNKGATHAIYWDGKKLHDSNPEVQISRWKDYKILMTMPIVKVDSHKRWKES